jgi:REP element-mobilizing transposase RayT
LSDNSNADEVTRRSRDEDAGALHHVVSQGNAGRQIVFDDRDRSAYSRRYEGVARRFGWSTSASCLMDTHHHVVVETPEPNLGVGMKRLLGGHSRWLNVRHNSEGSVFRQHYWSRRIEDDGWLFRACLYVVLNPVAAGLCTHPRDWPWCSFSATADGAGDEYGPGEERFLSLFADSPREARRRYAEVVDEMVELIAARRVRDGRALWHSLGRAGRR